MELTVEQTLQQAITAHKEGKLEDAQRLYTTILRAQPAHPDASHNLGVLLVSVNKVKLALPLFKTALEANPKIEQFWLSYIDALMKESQFTKAKKILEKAKKKGLALEKLIVLEAQLTSINEPEKVGDLSPSQEQLSNLLDHYQNGQSHNAEKLAISLTKKFPKHQFGWKVLGAVMKKTGRVSESLVASQKSVQINPQDAEAHNNIGNTLKELGRLDEAEVCYKHAIALKPNSAMAHSNLGSVLHDLGRLEEAKASCKQAIAIKPDYARGHSNLANTLKELGRLNEAEAAYRQSIELQPDYAISHNNLGVTLQELGRFEDAIASHKKAISLTPDYSEAYNDLGIALLNIGRHQEALRELMTSGGFISFNINNGFTLL